ncbi:TPA: exotoxin [Yersinia enterocolitica]|nr:exotoxin [Yersinia enterocolitica]
MINNILFVVLFLIILTTNVYADNNKICFYADEDYQGASICATQGQAVSDLKTEWNDKISSITIPPGMVATAFKDINFSGDNFTFKESVDLFLSRHWTNLDNAISSFKVRSAACFYEFDNFQGDSVCISGNESIDLYNGTQGKRKHVINPLNDRINSILLPPDTQTVVYKNDNYIGEHFVLTESYSALELERIGMDNNISSIKVYHSEYFICDRFCAVKNSIIFPIQYSFGNYWSDKRIGSKQVLISLDITNDDDFSIEIAGGGLFKVKAHEVFFINGHSNASAIFKLTGKGDKLSMLSRFDGGFSEIQIIESLNGRALSIYPIFSYLFDVDNTEIRFFINNASSSKPLVIDKIVMTVEKEHNREERSFVGKSICWLVPLLNIYNYIIQGGCNQVDHFITDVNKFFSENNNKVLQVFGTSKPLGKIKNNEAIFFEELLLDVSSEPAGILTNISSDMNGQSITLPATALACNIPMKEEILPHLRSRRDVIPPCITWTLNILTDFTLLFGDSLSTWNTENFGRVISRIVNSGDTGYAVSDTVTDARLVANVRAFVAMNLDNVAILKTAFDFSQLSYSDYLRHNHPETEVQPPQIVQLLPQGRYELALQNFQFSDTVPRRQVDGGWVEQPELHFDVEVISGATESSRAARRSVMPIVEQWREEYRQASRMLETVGEIQNTGNIQQHEGIDSVIAAANMVSDVAQSWLRTPRDDYIYVIVRLSGEIISIALAVDINDFDVGIAGSLTRPSYVLHPTANGAIRGAGTAALRTLAEYLAKKGKRALVSDVISQPSAIVKKKVGFQYINEL